MPISISDVSQEQKHRILELAEGHFADLKAKEIKPASLSHHLSALANADGGELFVGIDEDRVTKLRSWRGFNSEEEANAHIQCFDSLFPLGQDFSYDFLRCKGETGLVLQISVLKTRDIKVATDGFPYIRRGASSIVVKSPDGLDRLKLDKGITTFETATVDADPIEITNSCNTLQFLLEIIPTAEPDIWLRKQQLIRDNKPVVAGILLFAEEPQALLPKRSAIKVYRYKTKDSVGSRETLDFNPITIEGCIYDQIKEAVDKTVKVVQDTVLLGAEGFENIQYPDVAIHEIVTNAVLHRDYSVADDIHVRIFDNRIEVESPGRLPGHITVDNILNERVARNGILVRLINKFPDPPNKDVGEGLNTAFEAMRKLRLKDPEITQRENSVVVNIRHESLASAEEIVMDYMKSHDRINNSIGREICRIPSENVMKRVFERLIERDMLERIPELKGKSVAYRKKNSISPISLDIIEEIDVEISK